MSDPYAGEIRMFAGSFAPNGWALCNGQLLPISEYELLFTLLGTTYGGDGQETFALPNLSGRVPVNMGTSRASGSTYTIGESAGVESVTLTTNQIPTHNHPLIASTNIATQSSPSNTVLAQSSGAQMYFGDVTDSSLAPNTLQTAGGSQPHENMQPYLAVNFIIALYGIFPSQN
jgi:microcystin-dependent protein